MIGIQRAAAPAQVQRYPPEPASRTRLRPSAGFFCGRLRRMRPGGLRAAGRIHFMIHNTIHPSSTVPDDAPRRPWRARKVGGFSHGIGVPSRGARQVARRSNEVFEKWRSGGAGASTARGFTEQRQAADLGHTRTLPVLPLEERRRPSFCMTTFCRHADRRSATRRMIANVP